MNIARKYASAFSHLLSTQAALKQLLPSGATSHQFVRQASKFRAALLKEFGKPLVIEEQKRPKLKKDQVRLRVYCCGINSVDFHNAAGSIEPKPELPFVPGFEVCGEILEVAPDEKNKLLRPGERAIALHSQFKGGFAEEMIVSNKDVWIVDNFMSFETGASLTNSYATALLALTRRAEVKDGDTVLINGAAGRVGLAAVDLAANVYRCKVIAVCANDERASIVRDRGAFATVVMSQQDLITEVNKITDGKGVKIIIDTIGGESFKKVVKCAADEAKIVVAGFASKKIPQITGDELMENSFSIIGVSLDQYRKKQYDVYKQCVTDVIEMSKENLIKPLKAKHFPLEDVNEALKTLKDKNSIGKFVLDIP
ncbi:quinone oxidoreductase-like protein 2 homolog [Folsomia candida]|uniref:Quinone oxidoreductase-like protein 2 n=1 Tax=Folsomia candida TaxID=158441 RepID=A0A226F2X8_FOLCA|nr:quinone oxidoreductase-like protein 2 homolog [Folsomia candida]OXA64133.1 Quinone oxidoreductase-like protein 2 [Folsomia candida]